MNRTVELTFRVLGYLVFWGWNLWFILWLWVGLGPLVVSQMLVASFYGMVPWHFAAFALALVSLPAAGAVLGLHPRLRGDPGRLLSVFYGIQAPLMLLIAIRLFAVQQLTWPTGLALTIVAVGAASLLRTLWVGGRETRGGWQLARLVAQTGYLLVGAWVAAVVALYGASFAATIARELPHEVATFRIQELLHPWMWVGLTFFGLTALMLGVFPVAMVGISSRAFQLVARATTERYGAGVTAGVAGLTLAGWLGAFVAADRQPQTAVFPALEAADTDAERRALLERSGEVRRGLVFARLASERTFEADPEGTHISGLWHRLVGEALAELPRTVWKGLFRPFVYHPHLDGFTWSGSRGWGRSPNDVAAATAAYGEFFDAPIEVAERETLVAAARQTWSWEDAQAGLLEVGQQKVHLARQEVAVEPHGDLARITVHDVYRNRTWDRQEVLLYFSLPESAAVTGLWLGPDEEHRFTYVVAPRGAAQEVYESQVRARKDPALLEQVGPRQYRLRAFPVEPRTGSTDDVFSITDEGPDLHLWIELVVPARDGDDGRSYPLPDTTEVRNLYWDADTVRTVDGAEVTVDDWLPASVAAPSAARTAHQAQIGEWVVRAEPAGPISPVPLGRVVVMVDGTRSMDARRPEVANALTRLRAVSDEVVVLCTVEERLGRCDDYDPATALAWGSTALETRLLEATAHAEGADALVVLTDSGSYSLAAAEERARARVGSVALPPLWLVHFGGDPQAYPDWTLDQLQRTGGGIGGSIEEVLVRMSDPDVLDGWRWSVGPSEGPATASSDPFVSLAARRLVRHLDTVQRSSGLSALDAMHAVAVGQHVVTPYSSMLVLVDDAQRKMLADAEKRADRFDREVIDAPPEVTSAPEPGILALLGFGGVALLVRRRFGAAR